MIGIEFAGARSDLFSAMRADLAASASSRDDSSLLRAWDPVSNQENNVRVRKGFTRLLNSIDSTSSLDSRSPAVSINSKGIPPVQTRSGYQVASGAGSRGDDCALALDDSIEEGRLTAFGRPTIASVSPEWTMRP